MNFQCSEKTFFGCQTIHLFYSLPPKKKAQVTPMTTGVGMFDRGNVISDPVAFVEYEFLKFDDESKDGIVTASATDLDVHVPFRRRFLTV